jgi:hypothetical protein
VSTPDVSVQVVGFDELVSGSLQLVDRIDHTAGPAMEQSAQQAAARVRGSVPVLTGALAGSVVAGSTHEGTAYMGMGEGLPYAGWIEYGGTRGRPYVDAGRYVYPAAHAVEPQLVAASSDNAKREIARFPWRTPRT